MYDRAVLAGETVKGSFGYAVAFYDDAILLSDLVADTITVQQMQQLVHDIANDRERDAGRLTVRMKVAAGTVRPFEMRVYKQLNDFGLTEKMILTFAETK